MKGSFAAFCSLHLLWFSQLQNILFPVVEESEVLELHSFLGGVDAEMPVKVGVSIGWLQYSWIWFQEFFKISSDHSMLLVSIYCWRLSMLLLLTSIGLQQIEESNSAFGVCLA
ncbi:hypothetical protein K1719_022309 [Acacia pycnantha]|nr:hypothetical protein K1719_022309 [Acacia pycnantha]